MPACCRTQQTNRSSSQAEKENKDPNGNRQLIFAVTAALIVGIICIVAVCILRRFGKMKSAQNRYEMEIRESATLEQNEQLLNGGVAHTESRSAEGQSSISPSEDGHPTTAEGRLNK